MIVDGMLQRALPITDQRERLADIEPGDQIIWRHGVPGIGESIRELRKEHPERHFYFEVHTEGRVDGDSFLVTRLPDC